MRWSVVTYRYLVELIIVGTIVGLAPLSEAQQSDAQMKDSSNQCLEQVRRGGSEWVECRATFAPDATGRAELSNKTFDIVRDAKCDGNIRLQRAALLEVRKEGGVLQLDPQNLLCSVTTNADTISGIDIILNPQITFQGGSVVDVSPRLTSITNLPGFIVGPLESAVESAYIRKQLAKGLDSFLVEALGK